MTDQNDSLPPPQPPDQPGIRPPLDLARVIAQVNWIRGKLNVEQKRKETEKQQP